MKPRMARVWNIKRQHDRNGVKLREMVFGDLSHVRNHRGDQDKWISVRTTKAVVIHLVQVRAQRRCVHVDHRRLTATAQSDSYRSVS